jgi:hypothetical protein
MTSPTSVRHAPAQADELGPGGAPADGNTFLEIIRIVHEKRRLAASGAAFERFDPTAPDIRGRRPGASKALSFTG